MHATARRSWLVVACVLALVAGCARSQEDSGPTTSSRPRADTSSTPRGPTRVTPRPSTGCGEEPDAEPVARSDPGDVEQTITVQGAPRHYRLAVPQRYDPKRPAPLVLNLHGAISNSLQASSYSDLPHAASKRGVIVVAPDANGGNWELAGTGNDAEFLNLLLDDVEDRYCIDRARVHAVGLSLGAWKVAVTACTLGDRFASIALVTVEVFPGDCEPLPVIAFHGTADVVVAYGRGGGTVEAAGTINAGVPPTLDNMASWARSGGCRPRPRLRRIARDVVLRTYPDCDREVDVALYTIEGGGHAWPGAKVDFVPPEWTTHSIEATGIILDWFEAHPQRAH